MQFNFYYFMLFFAVFFRRAEGEITTESTTTLLEIYRRDIDASHDLDRSDRTLMKTWTSDFLLQIVNITSLYRLDMARHKEHSFLAIKANPKWKECIKLHQNEINNAETTYYTQESDCVKTANEDEANKRLSVGQMEKEIRKWRKSFRYLSNKCNVNHPGEEDDAAECLVEYMQKDNYHAAFQRLLLLKLDTMSELYKQILTSLRGLETCLGAVLSQYLTDVRYVMKNLNHCYNIKTLIE